LFKWKLNIFSNFFEAGLPGPFGYLPTVTGPAAAADNRSYYDYSAPMGLTAASLSGLGAQATGAHRHNDTSNGAAVYAIANQFNREQMIQRSSMQPYVRNALTSPLFKFHLII
jgi:hypothetical protein